MPPYKEDDPDIKAVLDRVVEFYEKSNYGPPTELLRVLHAYHPQTEWKTAYLQHIVSYNQVYFPSVMEAFEIFHDDSILVEAIEKGLPLINSASEDFNNFLDWIMITRRVTYNSALATIIENSYLEKWWDYYKDRKLPKGDYLRLLSHFA